MTMHSGSRKPLRINVGAASDYTDPQGNLWLADTARREGTPYDRGALPLAAGAVPALHGTGRENISRLTIGVPDGLYTVLLHFCESDPAVQGAGQRVFNLSVNGTRIAGIDVWNRAAGSGVPYVASVPVVVDHGRMDIDCIPLAGAAMLSAVEALPLAASELGIDPAETMCIDDFGGFTGPDAAFAIDAGSNECALSADTRFSPGGGRSLRFDYHVDTRYTYSNTCRFSLSRSLDLSAARSLELWIKPDGTGRPLYWGIRDADGQWGVAALLLKGVDPCLVRVPLDDFGYRPTCALPGGRPDRARIAGMTFVVNSCAGAPLGCGTVFLGRIAASADPSAFNFAPLPLADQRVLSPSVKAFDTFLSYRSDVELAANWYWNAHGGWLAQSLIDTEHSRHGRGMRIDYTFGKCQYASVVSFDRRDWRGYNALRFKLRGDGSGNILFWFATTVHQWSFTIPNDETGVRVVTKPLAEFMGDVADLAHVDKFGLFIRHVGKQDRGFLEIYEIELVNDPALGPALAPPPVPVALPGDRVVRIDCGSESDITDENGVQWLSDRGYVYGWESHFMPRTYRNAPVPIVYYTQRIDAEGYRFRIPDGAYLVRVHLAEEWGGAKVPGTRVFGLDINGTDFGPIDVCRETGDLYVPLIKEALVQVRGGRLDIGLKAMANMTAIAAVEIIPERLIPARSSRQGMPS